MAQGKVLEIGVGPGVNLVHYDTARVTNVYALEPNPGMIRMAEHQEWALDFVHDAVDCGRTIRVLSVVDAYTRECLALEVDTSFASRRVTRVLEAIVAERDSLWRFAATTGRN